MLKWVVSKFSTFPPPLFSNPQIFNLAEMSFFFFGKETLDYVFLFLFFFQQL